VRKEERRMRKELKVMVSLILAVVAVSLLAFASGSPETARAITDNGLDKLAAGWGMGFAVIGGGIGQGLIGAKAMESIGRNPESSRALTTPMLLALAFVESLVIYMLVIAFLKL